MDVQGRRGRCGVLSALRHEATAGIEPAMKVLQTSRPFSTRAFENMRKFKKVALPADYLGCADLCGSPHAVTLMFSLLAKARSRA